MSTSLGWVHVALMIIMNYSLLLLQIQLRLRRSKRTTPLLHWLFMACCQYGATLDKILGSLMAPVMTFTSFMHLLIPLKHTIKTPTSTIRDTSTLSSQSSTSRWSCTGFLSSKSCHKCDRYHSARHTIDWWWKVHV